MEPETKTTIPPKKFLKPSIPNKAALILVSVMFLVAGFWGGIFFEKYRASILDLDIGGLRPIINQGQEERQPSPVDFSLFWEVWGKIHREYVDKEELDTQEMVYGAIEGMVKAVGDPFTNFLKPEISEKFREEISGSFSGVGIEIGIRKNQLTVIAPLKNTPAYRAGVEAGDKIIKIDDKDTAGITLREAVSLIRGERGSKVILTMAREGLDEPKEISIIRDKIKIPTIELSFIGENQRIAHIEIYTFNNNVDSDFRDAAKKILASNADRIILDIRNNPGGLLDSAIYISSWFLEKDSTVVIEKLGSGKESALKAKNIGSLKHLPVVIIVNKGSASASEILAGALQDNRGIQIIGEKTFGKGSVQMLYELDGKSSLKVTIAKWLTPNGRSINDDGIQPNIEVERTSEDMDNDKDPQLDKAIEIIKNL